ncbi:MAG: hypothetical protein HKM98_11170 [Gammaproteobacteria bacterium]|nr:hypothetical protein [Gammaproteobacteria bacterium]
MATKKQIFTSIIAYLLGFLSLAAGIPKILQMPQELTFLSSIGLSGIAVSILGIIQAAGGVMLFWSRTRLAGASLAAIALAVSSIAIFIGGNSSFGLISLLPLLFVGILVYLILTEGKTAPPS